MTVKYSNKTTLEAVAHVRSIASCFEWGEHASAVAPVHGPFRARNCKICYSMFARTMDTVVYYIANFHDRLFNLVHILLERAIASVHVLTKP